MYTHFMMKMTKEKFNQLFVKGFGFGIVMVIFFVLVAPLLVAVQEREARDAMELQNMELKTRLEFCKRPSLTS